MEAQEKVSLNYDHINLPKTVDAILADDCTVIENMPAFYAVGLSDPIKFSASALIHFRGTRTVVLINLIEHVLEGSCAVMISQGDILQILSIDTSATLDVVVLSERMINRLNMYYSEGDIFTYGYGGHVFPLTEATEEQFVRYIKELSAISADTSNPHLFEAQIHITCTFIFSCGYKIFTRQRDQQHTPGTQERVTEAFLALAREHFRTERFLDFYASKLGITPKHLSRTIRTRTGISAVDWITRYVILEAKVLLRATSMSINDISTNLSFPSQSFFGKYFKRYTGVSPTEYRNNPNIKQ